MSGTVQGVVQVILSARDKDLANNFKKAGNELKNFGSGLSSITKWVIGLSSAYAVMKAVDMAKHSMERVSSLRAESEQLGMTTESLQGLSYAAASFGVNQENITKAMENFGKVLSEARGGNEKAIESFKKLDISMEDINKKSTYDQLMMVSEGMKNFGDGTEKTNAMLQLFGKSSLEMREFLSSGPDKINALSREFRGLGLTLNTGDIQNIVKINRDFEKLGKLGESITDVFMSQLSPWVEKISDAFVQGAMDTNGFRKQIAELIDGIAIGINHIIDAGQRIGVVWKTAQSVAMTAVAGVSMALEKTGATTKEFTAAAFDEAMKSDKAADKLNADRILKNQAFEKWLADVRQSRFTRQIADAKKEEAINAETWSQKVAREKQEWDKYVKEETRRREDAVKENQKMISAAEWDQQVIEAKRNLYLKIGNEQKGDELYFEERRRSIEKFASDPTSDPMVVYQYQVNLELERLAAEQEENEKQNARARMEAYASIAGNFATATDEMAKQSTEAFWFNKALRISEAGMNAWMAYSQTLASDFSRSNPITAQVLAASQLAAGMAAVANIATAQPPGRAAGGQAGRGGLYEVAERGPELLSIGSKSFLLMGGKDGRVSPADTANVGGPRVTVNVHNAPGTTSTVRQGGTANAPTIDVMVEQVEQAIAAGVRRGDSPVARAGQDAYGWNRARGAR
jgi:hypothetical protein